MVLVPVVGLNEPVLSVASFPFPLLSLHRLTAPLLCVIVAASAASSHKAREAPRVAGVHALAGVMVEPTQMELAGTPTVGVVFTVAVTAVLVAVVHPFRVAST